MTRVPQLSQLAIIKSLSDPITRCCHPLIVDGAAGLYTGLWLYTNTTNCSKPITFAINVCSLVDTRDDIR